MDVLRCLSCPYGFQLQTHISILLMRTDWIPTFRMLIALYTIFTLAIWWALSMLYQPDTA